MSRDRILVVFLSLTLLFLLTACSQETEPVVNQDEVTTDQDQITETIEVDYTTTIDDYNNYIDNLLKDMGLNNEEFTLQSSEEKRERKVDDYHFTWTYNYRELEIPLFGNKLKLLETIKGEIIDKLEDEFAIVEADWVDEEQQVLNIKLAFKPQSTGEKIITHQLKLVQAKPKAKLAIILDDWGFNRKGTEEMLSINRPLTMAVLPFRPHSQKDAKLIKEAGFEMTLHQPLEPMNPEVNPGEGAIYTTMSSEEIKETLEKNLASLPDVLGVNHHMGSKASADSHVMAEIMNVLRENDLFYVDSSTSHKSVGFETAVEYGVPTAANYLFIDNVDKKEAVEKMLLRLAKVALKKKELVIIGHIRMNTALAIQEMIPTIEDMGVKLVYVSELVR
ncbi:hypothetical protein BX659_12833 [Orenia metallireducens]|uniref:Divergent polysaccharide deacetylase n=1 Tax=Orenia metallireducens TaxID=1413210 RepID=A0A285I6Q8_9FIRM|nr:divergent polysaccharide deacetylase family protein [Orenia metallireducens]PRX22479.1 hypothetical protein BX659_12833 [Orenia metallireducens]SNY43695.1 hypothetical protein SAMN06265827_13233 [Orenia metallireducens]